MSWHRHVWKVVEKLEQPSVIESYSAVGATIEANGAWPDQLARLSRKSFVVTRRCEVCGTEEVQRL